jgi:two-component system, response regulator, stage 0 sporulation protein F
MKFLIVDDEKDVKDLFLQQFRREIRSGSIELCFAFSGKEAMEILASTEPPDVVYVFSDINMPGMSGLQLLEMIKEHHPQIKVSMISAYGDADNYNKAKSSGAEGFFTKPIDFKDLKVKINDFLNQQTNK